MSRQHHPFRPNAHLLPPNISCGAFCILSWIVKDPYAPEYFKMATDEKIRSVLRILPTLIDTLAETPGPFSEYVAEYAAAVARAAIDDIA